MYKLRGWDAKNLEEDYIINKLTTFVIIDHNISAELD